MQPHEDMQGQDDHPLNLVDKVINAFETDFLNSTTLIEPIFIEALKYLAEKDGKDSKDSFYEIKDSLERHINRVHEGYEQKYVVSFALETIGTYAVFADMGYSSSQNFIDRMFYYRSALLAFNPDIPVSMKTFDEMSELEVESFLFENIPSYYASVEEYGPVMTFFCKAIDSIEIKVNEIGGIFLFPSIVDCNCKILPDTYDEVYYQREED